MDYPVWCILLLIKKKDYPVWCSTPNTSLGSGDISSLQKLALDYLQGVFLTHFEHLQLYVTCYTISKFVFLFPLVHSHASTTIGICTYHRSNHWGCLNACSWSTSLSKERIINFLCWWKYFLHHVCGYEKQFKLMFIL